MTTKTNMSTTHRYTVMHESNLVDGVARGQSLKPRS